MMLGLRWTLGLAAALATCGWAALAGAGSGLRRSFGASANPVWVVALPVLAGGVVVASLLWPERRALLHAAAAVVLLLVVGCVAIARETLFVAGLGALYAAGWLWFYARALRR